MTAVRSGSIVLPQFDSEETINGLQQIAQEALDAQLEKLREELASFAQRKNVRMSTLEARVDEFDALSAKAASYETILEMNLEVLKEQVLAAKTALVDSLSAIEAEDAKTVGD